MLEEVHGESEVRDAIRKNLIINGKFSQAKVEEKMKEISEIPAPLVQAFLNMQKSAIKFRLDNDPDYQEMLKPGAPNNQEEIAHLKKL